MRQNRITIVGAGLAGSEAAWQIASAGIGVDLYEMRPTRKTEAHTTTDCAELVCSNSFGSDSPHHASRLLKEEVERMGGLAHSPGSGAQRSGRDSRSLLIGSLSPEP